jgi:hypothetical protein
MNTKMDTQRMAGTTDSQPWLGVRFGVHFQPNAVDLVDSRDFRDFTPSRVSDWESAK